MGGGSLHTLEDTFSLSVAHVILTFFSPKTVGTIFTKFNMPPFVNCYVLTCI